MPDGEWTTFEAYGAASPLDDYSQLCHTEYEFRISAFGDGQTYANVWGPTSFVESAKTHKCSKSLSTNYRGPIGIFPGGHVEIRAKHTWTVTYIDGKRYHSFQSHQNSVWVNNVTSIEGAGKFVGTVSNANTKVFIIDTREDSDDKPSPAITILGAQWGPDFLQEDDAYHVGGIRAFDEGPGSPSALHSAEHTTAYAEIRYVIQLCAKPTTNCLGIKGGDPAVTDTFRLDLW